VNVGVVLGGGGEVGVAWETGVLAALQVGACLDLRSCSVVAGTSAGSIVGATIACGADVQEMHQLNLSGNAPSPVPAEEYGDPRTRGDIMLSGPHPISAEMLALLSDKDTPTDVQARAIGEVALRTETLIDEARFTSAFATLIGSDTWPALDFRPTAVEALTGETVLWQKSSGIGFAAAVASSCSIPGFFPPIRFGDGAYMDSGRTPFSPMLVKEKGLDVLIFVGLVLPMLGNVEVDAIEQLGSEGVCVVAITGGAAAAELQNRLMDYSARPQAAAIGHADGLEAAERIRAALSA
jgi:NTE family protein